ncbi:GTP binding protein [Striga asiatica]|uniref:GTP binding protein n=1 Tax=Striga asiatica TaxID=4170 RepID=A0A5A7Q0H6_STRAF|nr:GTP binding protein [Striga asiatica]
MPMGTLSLGSTITSTALAELEYPIPMRSSLWMPEETLFSPSAANASSNWFLYDGETTDNPRFTVMKRKSINNSRKWAAHVISNDSNNHNNYVIEANHCCYCVYDEKRRRRVVELKPKENFCQRPRFWCRCFPIASIP